MHFANDILKYTLAATKVEDDIDGSGNDETGIATFADTVIV